MLKARLIKLEVVSVATFAIFALHERQQGQRAVVLAVVRAWRGASNDEVRWKAAVEEQRAAQISETEPALPRGRSEFGLKGP